MKKEISVIFKKENLKFLIISALCLVFGVMFLVLSSSFYDYLTALVGVVLVLIGVLLMFCYTCLPPDGKIAKLMLYGVLCLVVGIIILCLPKLFIIVISILIALTGVSLVYEAIKQKKDKQSWVRTFIIGIVITVLAVVLIILSGTKLGKDILAIYLGIMLLFEAIYNIIVIVGIVKQTKMFEEMENHKDNNENTSENEETLKAELNKESEENLKTDLNEENKNTGKK